MKLRLLFPGVRKKPRLTRAEFANERVRELDRAIAHSFTAPLFIAAEPREACPTHGHLCAMPNWAGWCSWRVARRSQRPPS